MSAVPGHGERRHTAHVVVPYGAANASVRARALEWIARLVRSGRIAPGAVVVHGPDWPRRPVPRDAPVLLSAIGGLGGKNLSDAELDFALEELERAAAGESVTSPRLLYTAAERERMESLLRIAGKEA